LVEYFTRLADEIALPLIIYNIPQRTGNPLAVETILKLSEHPRILGVKDTSENFMAISRMISLTRGRNDFAVLPGTETLMAPAVLMGGAGAVLGVANLAPHFCVRLYDAARADDLDRVRVLQDQMEDLFRIFRHYSRGEVSIGAGLGGLKLAVSLLGLLDERQCFPGHRPGDAAEMKEMVDGWIAQGIIEPPK
jgi:4-hydroxy-tetrahydrodipicolinate synthase